MKYLLYLHIACGFASLLAFWAPVFTGKGSTAHRKIGFFYTYAMWAVVISAAILSVNNLVIGQTNMGLFLGFLSVISATPLWHGLAVLKNKKSLSRRFRFTQIFLGILQFLFGAFLVIYGAFYITDGIRVLMIFFGVLGVSSIRDVMKMIWANQDEKPDWYRDHYRGMITSGIAAYTAFLAFGGRQFLSEILPGMWQVLPWILPTIIGVVAMRLMDRKRSRKTSAKTQTA